MATEEQREVSKAMEIIKAIGNRTIIVYKDKQEGRVDLEILLRGKHLATLVMERGEAVRLFQELSKTLWQKFSDASEAVWNG